MTLNWLVLLSAQAQAHSSPAFQKEMKQLTFFVEGRLHPIEGVAPAGLQSPQQGAVENYTQAELDTLLLGQRYLLQAVPKLGGSRHMTASVQ